MNSQLRKAGLIAHELRKHVPFTAFGSLIGIAIVFLTIRFKLPKEFSITLFWTLHPLHVLLSALVTTAVYRLHSNSSLCHAILVGYIGSVGIATLSDSIVPFAGEWLLDLPNRGLHIGFIEKWWLINPLAFVGIAVGYWFPKTTFPHFGHVLLSVWASLFHITMALGTDMSIGMLFSIGLFLFLAVWLPCCTSDIVFPLLWIRTDTLAKR
ncbi:MAG: hypothetical protein JXA04_01625 [Gammaproteobacteria bacterium]|nr:hypothetical protein [Gammaproteobacteria bacterium]